MSSEYDVERLLRWRSARAEADAPPAPSARQLIALARPWWERLPEQFAAYVERLRGQQLVYAHAATTPTQGQGPYPVPALLVRVAQEVESSARVLYLSVRDGRLRMRFRLDADSAVAEPRLEVTFVSDDQSRPLLEAVASQSTGHEYHLEVELPEWLESIWSELRVSDRMPFRFIMHAPSTAG
ncbi:MAG TPA: hypothetical protein VKA54_08525 [Gemmatimonadaceae bacterium]|nr:hypothetical protein [Gemmatimonadaceae bacterium]